MSYDKAIEDLKSQTRPNITATAKKYKWHKLSRATEASLARARNLWNTLLTFYQRQEDVSMLSSLRARGNTSYPF